ncbi:5-oxoprolinase subunit PxpB [Maribacter sp. 2304DJ31-5]|uniref:5-oxoprolinase subunit PxpB n=1 Tax=Maribacter sp. 2304DJ31-5 TaxID=3386273 RepID=UPI0039BC7936
MSFLPIHIKPFGNYALLIEWLDEVSENTLNTILQFEFHLKSNYLKEKEWETVPAYNSLMIINRNLEIDASEWNTKLIDWYAELQKMKVKVFKKHLWKLPVCYDAALGMDMPYITETLGLSKEEIVELHTTATYTVYGIGFLPGFMYLGGLPKALEIPRRTSPRLKVPQGAVGIAGKQTGIYPQESPGGWHIIGQCFVPMFNRDKECPCFVSVGDKIRFYPISRAEYELHKIETEVGIYQLEKTMLNA